MVNKVLSDGNARKQDFIALMKTRFSETQLTLDQKFKDIEIKQSLTEISDQEFERKMDKINQTLIAKVNGIENRMNTNIRILCQHTKA